MALAAQYPGHIVIADDPQNIIFGTCQVGDEFGEVKSASVKRTADKEDLANAKGSLKAAVLRNPRFELTLETLFTADVAAPGLGEQIAFPLVDVVGRILDVEVKWEDASGRMLSITATKWDSLNGETAEHFDGNTWTDVEDTVEVSTPAAPTLSTAVINAAGTVLTLTFNAPVTTPIISSGVTLAASVTGAVGAVYASGSGSNVIVYNLSAEIQDADVVTLDYVQPGGGIQSLGGVDVASINDRAVTNNSTQV
jgi:hypothetical protein